MPSLRRQLICLSPESKPRVGQGRDFDACSWGLLVSFLSFFLFMFLWCLAQLSRQAHKVCLLYTHAPASIVVVSRGSSTISNILSSETAWPTKTKFHVDPPWEGDRKFV